MRKGLPGSTSLALASILWLIGSDALAGVCVSIMWCADFDMDISRQPDPKGDRVKVVMTGKFLPYKRY